MVDDRLDEPLLLEVSNGDAGERAVDLHALDEDRLRGEGGKGVNDCVKGNVPGSRPRR